MPVRQKSWHVLRLISSVFYFVPQAALCHDFIVYLPSCTVQFRGAQGRMGLCQGCRRPSWRTRFVTALPSDVDGFKTRIARLDEREKALEADRRGLPE